MRWSGLPQTLALCPNVPTHEYTARYFCCWINIQQNPLYSHCDTVLSSWFFFHKCCPSPQKKICIYSFQIVILYMKIKEKEIGRQKISWLRRESNRLERRGLQEGKGMRGREASIKDWIIPKQKTRRGLCKGIGSARKRFLFRDSDTNSLQRHKITSYLFCARDFQRPSSTTHYNDIKFRCGASVKIRSALRVCG